MVSISKFGDSAIKFTFDDSDHYLMGDGEITVPVNGLILVLDESDMATFKKIDGDPFISFNIANSNFSSKSDLETFYKENMVGSTGGGGVTSGDVETMISEATSGLAESSAVTEEISEAVSGKADTSAVTASINAAVSGKMDTSAFNTYSASTDARISEDEEVTSAALNALDDALDDKADTSAVTASIAAAVSGKQDTLIAGSGITISGNVISAEVGVNVVQTTGTSSADVMSQSAVTNGLNDKYDNISLSVVLDEHQQFDGRTDLYGHKGSTQNLIFEASSINGKQVLNHSYSTSNKFDLVETSAITTSVTTASTDSQVPSAKAVYDALQGGGGGGKAIEAGRGIAITTGATADTVSFDLPISAGTGTDSIIAFDTNNVQTSKSLAFGSGNTFSSSNNYTKNFAFGDKNSSYGSSNIFLGDENRTYTAANSNVAIGQKNSTGIRVNKSVMIGNSNYIDANITSTFIIGSSARAINSYEIASSRFNVSNKDNPNYGSSGNTLFSVGNGATDNIRHNAFEIRQNGDIYIADTNDTTYQNYYEKPMIKLQDQLGGGLPESAFTAYTAATEARLAEDEEVTAAALNTLNDALDDKADASDLGGLKLVSLTQAEYDALTTKDASTLYFITNVVS